MTANLRLVRGGKEPIILWRRRSWTSMPHLTRYQGWTEAETRCGMHVTLGHGIVAITQTQITAEMFFAVGCGLCCMGMARDLRRELTDARPELQDKYKRLLKSLEWMSE